MSSGQGVICWVRRRFSRNTLELAEQPELWCRAARAARGWSSSSSPHLAPSSLPGLPLLASAWCQVIICLKPTLCLLPPEFSFTITQVIAWQPALSTGNGTMIGRFILTLRFLVFCQTMESSKKSARNCGFSEIHPLKETHYCNDLFFRHHDQHHDVHHDHVQGLWQCECLLGRGCLLWQVRRGRKY